MVMGQAFKIDRILGGKNAMLLNAHDAMVTLRALITQAVRDGDDRLALALDEVLQQVEAIAEDAARLPSGCVATDRIDITMALRG